MKPGRVDLPPIWRGSDYLPIVFRWKDGNGNPFNLTGWLPFAQSTNINFNPVITDPVNGVTQFSLSSAQTGATRLGIESWDWIWLQANVTPNITYPPILSGKVEIKDPTSDAFVNQ